MMYCNDDIQSMINKVNKDADFKEKFRKNLIGSAMDNGAIFDVLMDGSVERFDRYDSDVCEQFVRAFEKALN